VHVYVCVLLPVFSLSVCRDNNDTIWIKQMTQHHNREML
jgi:hypothetical protein